MDYVKRNQQIWDDLVKQQNIWSRPVSTEEIEKAKNGKWSIVLTPKKKVPRNWFPEKIAGKKVLCLASGGGQQGPIMAALGAEVTVFDNSEKQLAQDQYVAKRDHLTIKTVQGDMRDLSVFKNESFDFIIHPWSNCFVDDILPVWKEAYRVLKKGGTLISGFANPLEYIFDINELEKGNFVVRHSIPYSDLTSITEEELNEFIAQGDGICFGHTLEDQIQGQISAGFLIAGFYEDVAGSILDKFINTAIATKAIKI